MTAAAMAVWSLAAMAADEPPVLGFNFELSRAGLIRDVSGNSLHGTLRGKPAFVDSPMGKALVMDGSTLVTTPAAPKLAMTKALTLDAWARLDDAKGMNCLLNMAGDRYRLAFAPGGAVYFGLKSDNSRADLYGAKAPPGKWVRVTCTFERPVLTIYVDGKQTSTAKWDNDIGRCGGLVIGAKTGGGEDGFHGALAALRIYNYARPPQAGDDQIVFGGGATMRPKLDVKETAGVASVDTGAMDFKLDLRKGVVTDLAAGGKTLIAGAKEPLLFATVMESKDYDGVTDRAKASFVAAAFSCEGLKTSTAGDVFTAAGKGSLAFPGGDAIDYTLELKAAKGSPRLEISVALAKRGAFRDRFLREIGLRQALALNVRKRVVQAADQGLRFDTRHLYHFHMHVEPMPIPDHNVWRRFYVDQDTDHSYRIWRAESADTAGLHVFDGRRAAGWTTLYDEQGGALFAYRGLSERAPKALFADADGGGQAVVYFYSPTQPAFDLADARLSAAVFGKPHLMDFVFFKGEEAFEQPDATLRQAWGVEKLASDGLTEFKPVVDEVDLWDAPASAGKESVLVMGGVPVPKGSVARASQARLFVRGKEAPCQFQPLAFWPDGSVKWILLVFPLDGDGGYRFKPGQGEGDEVAFRVTLRKGEDVACALRFGRNVKAGEIGDGLTASASGEGVVVNTGPLQAKLGKGLRWADSVKVNGREMLAAGEQAQAFVDFLRPAAYAEGSTHAQGADDPGPVKIEKIDLEEAGPLRAVVRLEGKARCKEPPRVILRLEFYKGRTFARLFHTVEFLHKDPRQAFVRAMGLRLPLTVDAGKARFAAGGQKGSVAIPAAPVVALRQTRHLNYEAWRLNGRVREIVDSAHLSRGWLDVSDGQGGLAVIERRMWQEGPKELLYRAKDGVFEIGLWPGSSPLMDVRRYSNYPHRSQGESAPYDQRWVLDAYYKNDPFVGVTKTHEMMLYFHGADVAPGVVDSVAADFQSQALVYAGWPWYAKVGVTYPQPDPADPKFKRFSENLDNAASWYLFHQKAWGWYGMWDFGDSHHAFRTGYGRIFPPATLAKLLKMKPEEMLKQPMNSLPQKQDYFTQGDWAFDNGRWGWSNTEGLVNHFMSQQYLRTGRRDVFFFMEANARHVRDVDARHAGAWYGRGTRHGVQHWSDGNHEERQTTFTEQRIHYLLTGEHRTREWNKDLSDNFYLKTTCSNHASHSGRSYGLLFRWEITGDPKLGELMKRYVSVFAQPEGIDISPVVEFPKAARWARPRTSTERACSSTRLGRCTR